MKNSVNSLNYKDRMSSISKNNKRIAYNTLVMYLRKAFTLLIALYTSRLLLKQLGDFEFGLYGLIGSVVVVFTSIKTLFASSIQRYINIEKGRTESDVQKIFSTGVRIQLIMSILFLLVAEIGGLIILPGLNFPKENYWDVFWILQMSLLTSAITMLTVPYDALIIANERFGAYAVITIIDSVLRMGIVFLLVLSPFSKVVFYSILILIVSIVVRGINMAYCRRVFKDEAKYKPVKAPKLFREMFKFTQWQFLGNLGFSLSQSGLNLVINLFGGVIVNAARTIAQQVLSSIQQFLTDAIVSFQPRTMILYAQGDVDGWKALTRLNSKACAFIFMTIAFPIALFTKNIISLWLGQIPPYVVIFIQIMLIYGAVRSLHGALDILFKANGNIKIYQISESVILSSVLLFSWLILKYGQPIYMVFLIMSALECVNLGFMLFLAHRQFNFEIMWYVRAVLCRFMIAFTIMVLIVLARYTFLTLDDINFIVLISYLILSIVFAILILMPIFFTKNEIVKLISTFKR